MFQNPEVAFGGAEKLFSLIDLIYSAVGKPDLWPVVLDGIAEASHGHSTVIYAGLPKDSVLALARFDPGSWEEYATHYAAVNVLSTLCDEVFPNGTVRYSHKVITDPDFEKTEFYADFFRRYDLHYSFGLKVPLGEGIAPAYISCQRSKAVGAFDDQEGLVFQTLMPHLQRALMLHLQFSSMEAKVLGLQTALDAFGNAVFGLDSQGNVTMANARAEELVRAGDGLALRNGRLTTLFSELNNELQRMISGVIQLSADGTPSAGGALHVPRKANKPPLRLVVSRFHGTLPGSHASVAALVFVADPESRPGSRGATLRTLYGLAPTEARIADLLLDGHNIREAGNIAGITEQTARFHLKRILAKTGTHKQTNLLKLMLSLPQV